MLKCAASLHQTSFIEVGDQSIKNCTVTLNILLSVVFYDPRFYTVNPVLNLNANNSKIIYLCLRGSDYSIK